MLKIRDPRPRLVKAMVLGLFVVSGAFVGVPEVFGQSGEPVRVGGSVKPPVRVKMVNPVYPPAARQARVQGAVILEVVVGVDGKVKSTKVLKSLGLVDQAATDAVKQWEFKPPVVNDKPASVIMTIPVNFKLS